MARHIYMAKLETNPPTAKPRLGLSPRTELRVLCPWAGVGEVPGEAVQGHQRLLVPSEP